MSNYNPEQLANIARRLRFQMLQLAKGVGGSHLGGSFSVIDLLVALYFNEICHRPKQPAWEGRDRLVFSKGHCGLALYTVLCEAGYFSESVLETYCRDGGSLGEHPRWGSVPGIEVSTGSLGHGLPIGNGIALFHQMKGQTNRVFVVMGDGDLNEGSTWEGMMFTAQYQLENLIAVIDLNKLIGLGHTNEILSIEPLEVRLQSFGWATKRIDGHNFHQILDALHDLPAERGRPTAIIADTVKGKGVSFMEGIPMWHRRRLTEEEYQQASRELGVTS